VGTSEEKVWYHANCKNRGRGCTNTRLVAQKGCCIWYNESKLFVDVEKRVGHNIDKKLPDVKTLHKYGEDEKEESGSRSMHLEKLRPAVQELAIMAKESQDYWLNMILKFDGIVTNKKKKEVNKNSNNGTSRKKSNNYNKKQKVSHHLV
jgi:ATP-dependent RNA helicase DDX1